MPTIITAHIRTVNRPAVRVHGRLADIPIAAIIESYCIDDDIWRSRRTRYSQARAVTSARQVEMSMRSRRESAAIDGALRTPPGKRRVLSVVLSARVIPGETECVDV